METIYFLIIGIVLYFGADWILKRIERARGARFVHRDAIYFIIILTLAMASFYLINRVGT
jgi:hypothetical protein